jgi:hypothetical protein
MAESTFTPFAIIPIPKYDPKDIKNDFGYKGQPDLPLENNSILEQQLLLAKPMMQVSNWLQKFKK